MITLAASKGASFLCQQTGDDSVATCSEHETEDAQHTDQRPRKIDGSKGCFAGEIRYEEAIYHAVQRGENHHPDGRHGKSPQPAVTKVTC